MGLLQTPMPLGQSSPRRSYMLAKSRHPAVRLALVGQQTTTPAEKNNL